VPRSPLQGSLVSRHVRAARVFTVKAESLVTARKPRWTSSSNMREATVRLMPIAAASRTE
jgi:hypothetical protein